MFPPQYGDSYGDRVEWVKHTRNAVEQRVQNNKLKDINPKKEHAKQRSLAPANDVKAGKHAEDQQKLRETENDRTQ